MKKRLISMLLTLAILFSTGSFIGAKATEEVPLSPAVSQPAVVVPTETPDYHGNVPAQSANLDGIIFPIHALTMCMVERGLTYDDTDPSFYWSGLYYMLGLYGQLDNRSELTDGTLILPPETVADYASALYASFDGLPALPADLADRITLRDDSCYVLGRGDASQTDTCIDDIIPQPDGTVLVAVSLLSVNEEPIAQFEITMSPNDGMFGYAILDAVQL